MFYIATKDGLTVSFPGNKTFQVAKDHANFDKVLKLVQSGKDVKFEEVEALVDLKKTITSITEGNVVFKLSAADELVVSLDGADIQVLDASLEYRLIQMLKSTEDDLRSATITSFAKFISNLYKNPSYQSVRQLYGFLEKNDLPITQNGTFLAYKKVRFDYLDIHSGTFNNAIGQNVQMPRYQVEDNPEKTCSRGLHVCSYDYLEHYASSDLDRVVICEVDPADVVSVPYDYDNAKMRVCKYKVVDEIPTFFDAQLASFIYGKHEDGWLMKTFESVVKVYRDFFKTSKVEFTSLPENVAVTPAVQSAFIAVLRKNFADIPEKFFEEFTESETTLPTIRDVITVLSKYDSKFVIEAENADAE